MPGGDIAAREPWRMAAAVLHALGRDAETAGRFAGHPYADKMARLLKQPGAPLTTSAGRLFDAVAGLLGTSTTQRYEGQAAMELEARVRKVRVDRAGWTIDDGVVSLLPLLEQLAAPGLNAVDGAELFHGTFAAAMVDLVTRSARAHGLRAVALGGGCFLNRVLTTEMRAGLLAAGIQPLIARAVPPNDGGLSLGQAWIAAGILNQQQASTSQPLTGSLPECV